MFSRSVELDYVDYICESSVICDMKLLICTIILNNNLSVVTSSSSSLTNIFRENLSILISINSISMRIY